MSSRFVTTGCFKCKATFTVDLELHPDVTTYPCEDCDAVAMGYALPDKARPPGS